MSATWQRLAGDTSKFALSLSFESNPDQDDASSPEESASWGAFQVWVEGRNLCAHTEPGGSVDSVHWYLLPMLEWFLSVWNPLLHEERSPVPEVDTASDAAWQYWRPTAPENWWEWWSRHNVQACRNGGLYPDVYLRRWRDMIEFSWDTRRIAGAPALFNFLATRGEARLPTEAVAGPLFTVIGDALAELRLKLPDSNRIAEAQELHNRLRASEADGQYRDRFAWLSGFGGASERFEMIWRRVQDSTRQLPSAVRDSLLTGKDHGLVITGTPQAAVLFGCLAPTVTEVDVVTVTRTLIASYKSGPDGSDGRLNELRESLDLSDAVAPWEAGNLLAQDVIDSLRLAPSPTVDIDGVLAELSISTDVMSLEDRSIRAISIAGPYHQPSIFVNDNFRHGSASWIRRFTLAHELCHLLIDRDEGRRIAVASGPWAPLAIEQRANAFAAALLMPEDDIESEAARASNAESITSRGAVEHLARRYSVGRLVVIDRLFNLGYMNRDERDRLRAWALALAEQAGRAGQAGEE